MTPLVSVVVLAAGLSSRMEGRHKLLLDFGEEPMLRHVLRSVLALPPAEVVVVTGFHAEDVRATLHGLPVRFAHNAGYEQGQPRSVVTGVRALTAYCHAVMIVLGDQPLLTTAHLRGLVDAYRDAEAGRSIVVPVRGNERGNPIVFAAHHCPDIGNGGLNVGCRRLIDSHPELVALVAMEDDAFFADCDTPADYAALRPRVRVAAS